MFSFSLSQSKTLLTLFEEDTDGNQVPHRGLALTGFACLWIRLQTGQYRELSHLEVPRSHSNKHIQNRIAIQSPRAYWALFEL